ncbi:RAD55 family ATPase [Halomicroarcula sp. S1AR25-4]|uniref:RAD55 family ATPase n=1 Tax=Haloarcula sp. S1AR25-4 TaxID=2950538 RepID=UPI0028765973|nr:RAD55 family ATPase [Halomicroarcula sp. S1AR25-4]MDS0279949.1 RAD55 family ATPase [Halomicroarcula sp. S1AR25-4]
MYDIGYDRLDFALDPGTNVLVTGPPLCGKRRFGMQALAAGSRRGEGGIVVTTRDTADRVRSDYRTLFAGGDEDAPPLGVVDAVSETFGQSVTDDQYTKYTSSPKDMSSIGIKFSEFVQSYYTEDGIERTRVLVDSLSPLLVYSNLQGVFRFIHMFTSRVDNAGAVGFYTVTSTAHDDETMNSLTQLVDGTIELTEDGTATIRLPNLDDQTVDL